MQLQGSSLQYQSDGVNFMEVSALIFTSRVRSTTEDNVFTLSTIGGEGGTYLPADRGVLTFQLTQGGCPILPDGEYPYPSSPPPPARVGIAQPG